MAVSRGSRINILLAILASAIAALFYYVSGLKGQKSAAEVEAFLSGTGSAQVTFFQLDPKSNVEGPEKRTGPQLRGWKIIREVPLTDSGEIDQIRSILTGSRSYGGENYRCFQPGMGLRFKAEHRTVEFILCLDCRHSHGYDDKIPPVGEPFKSWTLSSSGVDRLMDVYKAHAGAKN